VAFVTSIPTAEESVTAVMQRYPDQARFLTQLTQIIMRTGECGFSTEQRELIAAFASGTNACTYCMDTHKATAAAFGLEPGLLDDLLGDVNSAAVDERLKPVLRYVKKLTQAPSRMTQADADAIFAAGWDEGSFHFTVMICALFNLYNRIMDGYGVKNTPEFRASRGGLLAQRGYGIVTESLPD
jgi:uncharacterized peroxidase-related enzyme